MLPERIRTLSCEWLTKSGDLSPVRTDLEKLRPALSKPEIVSFYVFLRDNAQRWESEWRKQFLEIFGIQDGDLPQIDDADRWSAILHRLVSEGDIHKVRSFIEGIGVPKWNFKPRRDEPIVDIYPLDDPDEAGELPVLKASRLGFSEVARYLDEMKRAIADRYREAWRREFGG